MEPFKRRRGAWGRIGWAMLAAVAGLLFCAVASADSITTGDTGSDVNLAGLDPFSGMPDADFSSPDALELASYWYSIVSDPWDNYSLIVELFGQQAADTLLAEETASPLVDPQADSVVTDPSVTADAQVTPEPVTMTIMGAGVAALLLWAATSLRSRRGRESG